jgi:hypothetical protein
MNFQLDGFPPALLEVVLLWHEIAQRIRCKADRTLERLDDVTRSETLRLVRHWQLLRRVGGE